MKLLRAHRARSAPRSTSDSIGLVPARTPITEARTALPMLARVGQWVKVRLPGRPNGRVGWISGRATVTSLTPWHIVVNLSRRQVKVYKEGHAIRSYKAVVGAPSTPTPTGRFFVEETVALQPDDAGAPFALALSARSDVIQEFEGGPGQIAIHGIRNIGGEPGTAVSHGCIRLNEEAIRWIAFRVGPGAPVTIVR